MARALSLPREHGGYLTALGSAAAGLLVSSAHAGALGAALALVAAFLGHGPVERLAVARSLGVADRGLLGAVACAIAVGAWLTSRTHPLLGLATAALSLVMLAGSYAARRQRRHRHPSFELLGMAALGAAAGLIALAGGAAPRPALLLALILGVHAALSVPLVRSELRKGERPLGPHAEALALAVLLALALGLLLSGERAPLLALAPRALHVLLRMLGLRGPTRASLVGLRETAALLVTLGLLVALL